MPALILPFYGLFHGGRFADDADLVTGLSGTIIVAGSSNRTIWRNSGLAASKVWINPSSPYNFQLR
jgi:hypothetical protein